MLKNRTYAGKRVRLYEENDRLGNLAEISKIFAGITNKINDLCELVENDPAYEEYTDDIMDYANHVLEMSGYVKKDLEVLTKKHYRYASMGESMVPRRILEGKNDSGLRNGVIYSFLTKRVGPIITNTLAEKGFKAEVHKPSPSEKIQRALIDVKSKGGINGMKQFAINYYDGTEVIAISNDKFMNGVKDSKGFLFVSPADNCVYGLPSTVLQSNWKNLLLDPRSERLGGSNIATVIDAIGMRNEISLCDPDILRELAASNGFVYAMSQANADKFKQELEEYKAIK